MNCDEAFEALTDANTRDDAELRWHLDHCPRCRAMEETLAPALDLFASSATSALSRDLFPNESGTPLLSPEALALAEQTAADLRRQKVSVEAASSESRADSARKFHVRYWAVLLVMMSAGLLFSWGFLQGDSARAGTVCTWKHPERTPEQSSRVVVMSCVSCHLRGQTFEN